MSIINPSIKTNTSRPKSNSIQKTLALFSPKNTQNNSGSKSAHLPGLDNIIPSDGKPAQFVSLYERTMTLISNLYSLPDYEYYLFPGGIDALMAGSTAPIIDPIAILWHCFRLGAPLCHLLNQLRPKVVLDVSDVSGLTTYTNMCKKCIYRFLIGVKEELGVGDEVIFSISELYKDDTNGLVKVIKTVNMVLDEINKRGLLPKPKRLPFATDLINTDLSDNRSRSIAELFTTERKYIAGLQELLAYQNDLIQSNVVTKDVIHGIFSNLAELLDFQRRFLFSLEANLVLSQDEQHIGAEEGFEVYDIMCANYSNANKIVLENLDRLTGIGSIDPARGLQAYLIQPVQRLCRYPMLLKEIVKFSQAALYPHCDELNQALDVIMRATDRVNEYQRTEENKTFKVSLIENIQDLQGMKIAEWGNLLLYDKFPMLAQEIEQLYHIYLFQNLILCCKESVREIKKRRSSKLADRMVYEIKGKILASSINEVVDDSDPSIQYYALKIFWNQRKESFLLKCRNAEQVLLWQKRIILTNSTGSRLDSKQVVQTSFDNSMNNMQASNRPDIQSANRVSMFVHERVSQNSDESSRKSMPASVGIRKVSKSGIEMPSRVSSIISAQTKFEKIEILSSPTLIPATEFLSRKSVPARLPMSSRHRPSKESPSNAQGISSNENLSALLAPLDCVPLSMVHDSLIPTVSLDSSRSSYPLTPITSPPPRSGLPVPPNHPTSGHLPIAGPPISKSPLSPTRGPPSSRLPRPPILNAKLSQVAPKNSNIKVKSAKASAAPHIPLPRSPIESPLLNKDSVRPRNEVDQTNHMELNRLSIPQIVESIPSRSPLIKMKTHYGDDIFILAVPSIGCKYEEIVEKIERKIRICHASMPQGRRIKIKYKDDEGDFITINTDDDIEMAFELARNMNQKGTVTFMVE